MVGGTIVLVAVGLVMTERRRDSDQPPVSEQGGQCGYSTFSTRSAAPAWS
jgi:hypothetical protein